MSSFYKQDILPPLPLCHHTFPLAHLSLGRRGQTSQCCVVKDGLTSVGPREQALLVTLAGHLAAPGLAFTCLQPQRVENSPPESQGHTPGS